MGYACFTCKKKHYITCFNNTHNKVCNLNKIFLIMLFNLRGYSMFIPVSTHSTFDATSLSIPLMLETRTHLTTETTACILYARVRRGGKSRNGSQAVPLITSHWLPEQRHCLLSLEDMILLVANQAGSVGIPTRNHKHRSPMS